MTFTLQSVLELSVPRAKSLLSGNLHTQAIHCFTLNNLFDISWFQNSLAELFKSLETDLKWKTW